MRLWWGEARYVEVVVRRVSSREWRMGLRLSKRRGLGMEQRNVLFFLMLRVDFDSTC